MCLWCLQLLAPRSPLPHHAVPQAARPRSAAEGWSIWEDREHLSKFLELKDLSSGFGFG